MQRFSVSICTLFLTSWVWADGQTVGETVRHVFQDQKAIVTSPLRMDRTDALVWGPAVAGIFGLAAHWNGHRSGDEQISSHIENHTSPTLSRAAKDLSYLGDGGVVIGASVVSYGISRWTDHPGFQNGSAHLFEAVAQASIWSNLLKIAAGRSRPSTGSDSSGFRGPAGFTKNSSSFPSGHATVAFAAADVLTQETQTAWVGVPAYSMATGVAISRVYVRKHWASDVVAGAALGQSLGMLVEHRRKGKPQDLGALYPWGDGEVVGIGWSKVF